LRLKLAWTFLKIKKNVNKKLKRPAKANIKKIETSETLKVKYSPSKQMAGTIFWEVRCYKQDLKGKKTSMPNNSYFLQLRTNH
jgi:hypothetical protein